MRRLRRHPSLALAAAAGLLASGCGSHDATPMSVERGTATIAFSREPTTFLDWHASTNVDLAAADLVFRRLARPAAEPGRFVPDLAASWSISSDGLELGVKLREGVRWEDGRPVSADDVVFSQERARAPGSSLASRKKSIVAVEARGPSEVAFRFSHRSPENLDAALGGHVYPKHLLESVLAEDLASHPFAHAPVGSGPFRLEQWEPGQSLTFAAREVVDQGSEVPVPRLGRLVARIFQDKAATYRELEAGKLDYVRRVDRDTFERLAAAGKLVPLRAPTTAYYFVAWNAKRPPFDRPAVRRALTALIDRRAIAARFEGPEGRVAEGPVPPGDPRRDPELTSPAYDPEAARRELEAGADRPLEVELLCHSVQASRDVAAVVADYLRQGGLAVEVRAVEAQALKQRTESGDFDAVLIPRAASQPVDLAACFKTASKSATDENYSGLSDATLDAWLDAEAAEPDAERALALHRQIQRRIAELQPWTFLFHPTETALVSRRLKGLDANPGDPLAVVEAWWIGPDD
jgi:peptide/nickel transport system substrate-binding protein